jgi:hypothetical protein
LRKNRRILEALNPTGKTTVTKTALLDEGFKFAYFTNEYKTKTGKYIDFATNTDICNWKVIFLRWFFRKEYVE